MCLWLIRIVHQCFLGVSSFDAGHEATLQISCSRDLNYKSVEASS